MQNTREKVAKVVGKVTDTKFSTLKGKVKIFPFVIRNGYQNVSQRGFEPKGTQSSAFSFFQKVFTGTETITATWKNSTKLNVRDADLGTYNYDFTVGDWYEGMTVPGSEVMKLEINDVNGNEDFMAMQESQEVTIMFSKNIRGEGSTEEHHFELSEDDLFNLYIIPEVFGNKWLYISNHQTFRHPKNDNVILTQVTFSSLKDMLEKSGRALEQYVQYAAPGEPYAFPFINADGTIKVSPLRLQPEQVKYLQVELQGASALGSITVFGRKIMWDEQNQKWYTSPGLILLPVTLLNPQANPLNKTSAPSKNFYFFPDEQVDVRATKDWLQSVKDQNQAFAQVKNMGAFSMGTGPNWEKQDNKYYGNWSNPVSPATGLHQDYISQSWKPVPILNAHGYNDGSWRNKSTAGNPYTTDTARYTGTDDMRQILIKNSMIFLSQLEIPLSFTSSRPYRWSSVPVIGFWTRWFGDHTIFPNTESVKNISLGYFVDCQIAEMAKQSYETVSESIDGRVIGSLQMFNGQETPPLLTPQASNTTIAFELTDLVSFTDSKYTGAAGNMQNGISTVYLSQIKNENGELLHSDGTPLLMNCSDGNMTPKLSTDDGWVIDTVMVQALHIGKVKVSCFGKYTYNNLSNPLFTQTVMSNSMFENENIRNWTTTIQLGSWDSNWSDGEINWPLEPQKPITEYETVIDYKGKLFSHNWGASGPSSWGLCAVKNNVITIPREVNWIRPNAEAKRLNEDKLSYINPQNQLFEYSYQQFGCLDRNDFIEKYETIQFPVDNSYIKLHCQDIAWKGDYSSDGKGKSIIARSDDFVYDAENDEYVWQRKQAICSINCSYNNPLAPIIDETPSITDYLNMDITKTLVGNEHKSGWSQCVNILIKLKQNSLTINLQEETSMYCYEHPLDYDTDDEVTFSYRTKGVPLLSFRLANLVSQIGIYKWILTKRQIPEPLPEGLYLLGGSNPLNATTTAGEDEAPWVLMREGQQVQETPIWSLQLIEPQVSNPFSTRISGNKVYIKWEAGAERRDYRLRLSANLQGETAAVFINAKIN